MRAEPGGTTTPTVEEQVERIWNDILGVPGGRAGATFFELQGQSISAVRIVARIEEQLGVEVDVAVLFDDPDLATFTRAVLRSTGARDGDAA